MYNGRMRNRRCLYAFIVVIFLLSTGFYTVIAQDFNELYIPETGHWIKGKFLDYYRSVDDPYLYFGYPITDAFTDPLNGRETQYFERARFDLTTEDYRSFIERAPLGELLYDNDGQQVDLDKSSSTCTYFSATNRYVCYAFLDFYNDHQGKNIFGSPISNLEWQEGRFVQYFEFARMEWHPESQTGQRVILSDLGRTYFNTRLGNPDFLNPDSTSVLDAINVELNVDVFVSKALIATGEKQTIYVITKNQHQVPVQGAMTKVTIQKENGNLDVFRPAPTDENGLTKLTLSLEDLNPNEIVKFMVEVTLDDLSSEATAWFRTWW